MFSFFSYVSLSLLALPFFPTRRSSDLTLHSAASRAKRLSCHCSHSSRRFWGNRGGRDYRRLSALSPSARTAWTSPGNKEDRKSTRLNSSHVAISYAVFCLKKKITKHPSFNYTRTRQREIIHTK